MNAGGANDGQHVAHWREGGEAPLRGAAGHELCLLSNGGRCVLGVRMTEGKVRGPKGHGLFWQKCVGCCVWKIWHIVGIYKY